MHRLDTQKKPLILGVGSAAFLLFYKIIAGQGVALTAAVCYDKIIDHAIKEGKDYGKCIGCLRAGK